MITKYTTIAEAINGGIENLAESLSSEITEGIERNKSRDIAEGLHTLARITMLVAADETAADALDEKYKDYAYTDANAMAKFMEAFAELIGAVSSDEGEH